jgi:hypothetical protein
MDGVSDPGGMRAGPAPRTNTLVCDSYASRRTERQLPQRLDALGPAPRAEVFHVLMLPDFDRADAIGSYWGNPKTRSFAELLIDCEEDRMLRGVFVGMLAEMERK